MPSTDTVVQATQPEGRPRYTCTLQGSQWDVAYYGIVEFLRVHPVWRTGVAAIGVLSFIFLVVDFVVTVPGVPKGSWLVFLFVTPSLLWMATVSGSSFELVFPAAKASAERQVAEQFFGHFEFQPDEGFDFGTEAPLRFRVFRFTTDHGGKRRLDPGQRSRYDVAGNPVSTLSTADEYSGQATG